MGMPLPRSHHGLPQFTSPTLSAPHSSNHVYPNSRSPNASYQGARHTTTAAGHSNSTQRASPHHFYDHDSAPNAKRRKLTADSAYETCRRATASIDSSMLPTRADETPKKKNPSRDHGQEDPFEKEHLPHESIQEQNKRNLNHILKTQVFPHIQSSIAASSIALTHQEGTGIGQKVRIEIQEVRYPLLLKHRKSMLTSLDCWRTSQTARFHSRPLHTRK